MIRESWWIQTACAECGREDYLMSGLCHGCRVSLGCATTDEYFDAISWVIPDASGVAWDGCHKLYVLMDDAQLFVMRDYEYVVSADGKSANYLLALLRKWYDDSCGLRFINSIRTVDGDPNDGFSVLIPQLFLDDDGNVVPA